MPGSATDVEVLTPREGLATGRIEPRFAGKGPPGAPGCCLWCGSRLRAPKGPPALTKGYRGDYADNAFCGLRCGYHFGLKLAIFGRRLQVAPELQSNSAGLGGPPGSLPETAHDAHE